MLSNWLLERGFMQHHNVSGLASINALFKNTDVCGIYILHFRNNEFYVGLAKNVVRRYSQHRRNHVDIERISFKPTTDKLLKAVEANDIDFFKSRLRLRNIDGMEDLIIERNVDNIINTEKAQLFVTDLDFNDFTGEKYVNDILHSNYLYQKSFKQLAQASFYTKLFTAVRRYILTCIPMPVKTEYKFWSITCFPLKVSNRCHTVLRLNIYQQEVFTVYHEVTHEQESILIYRFHLAKSPFQKLANNKTGIDRVEKLFYSAVFNDNYYRTGGKDQMRLKVSSHDIQRLLYIPEVIQAARLHNLRLMRKGVNINRASHCMALSEQLLK